MKKNKLKLNDLKVESFVTKLDHNEKVTVDGGLDSYEGPVCVTQTFVTAVLPTTQVLGYAEIAATVHEITIKTVVTQGQRTQSAYAVACSRFICKTYNDIMKSVCC